MRSDPSEAERFIQVHKELASKLAGRRASKTSGGTSATGQEPKKC